MAESDERIDLLNRAKRGDAECLGSLLELYRNYLYLVARTQVDLHLRVRASPSDIVQDTFLKAFRSFSDFRGRSEAELLAWLRQILVNSIVTAFDRHVRSRKRNVRREQSLEALGKLLDQSTRQMEQVLAVQGASPSAVVQRRELAARVADHLAELPDHYREVIVLRNLEGLSFNEVAQKMGRTSQATRQLWTRAIRRLRLIDEDNSNENSQIT